MTDYPAHIGARACELLNEEYGPPVMFRPEKEFDHPEVQAVCRALMETVPEPVDPLVEAAQEVAVGAAQKLGIKLKAYAVEQEWADNLRQALAKRGLHIAPTPVPVSEERIEEMAREVWRARMLHGGGIDPLRAGIKRGLAERGEVK